MIRNDYIKELGADPTIKTVPWPYALAVLVLLAAGVIWFAVSEVHSHPSIPQADHAALTAQQPGHPLTVPRPLPEAGRLTRGLT